MAQDRDLPVACPPHHWLVEETGDGCQQWTCHRCGTAKEQEVPPDTFETRFGRNRPTAPPHTGKTAPKFPRSDS
jgi:hypothetical protein